MAGAHKRGAKGKKSSPGKPNEKAPMPYRIADPIETPAWRGENFASARTMWFGWLRKIRSL